MRNCYKKKGNAVAIIVAVLVGTLLLGGLASFGGWFEKNPIKEVQRAFLSKTVDISKDVTVSGMSSVVNNAVVLRSNKGNAITFPVSVTESGLYALKVTGDHAIAKTGAESVYFRTFVSNKDDEFGAVSTNNIEIDATKEVNGYMIYISYVYLDAGTNTLTYYEDADCNITKISIECVKEVDIELLNISAKTYDGTAKAANANGQIFLSGNGTDGETAFIEFSVKKTGEYDFTLLAGGKTEGTIVKLYDSEGQLIKSVKIAEALNIIGNVVPYYNNMSTVFVDPDITFALEKGVYRVEICASPNSVDVAVLIAGAYLTQN